MAKSAGLKTAMVELETKAVAVADGLATTFPDHDLPSSSRRGATPSTPSFKVTRVAVPIVSATAGANVTNVAASFDDNEMTGWKNDGKRATAWIEFELARSANVNAVVLKLGGWRSKAYPLRAVVGGKEAWIGTTPKSLGYVTLPLKPTAGKTVRIELIGAVDDKDGFGLVEVTGKKLADTADTGVRGALEIVEAEIYEPASR
jgi:hypothetical protein